MGVLWMEVAQCLRDANRLVREPAESGHDAAGPAGGEDAASSGGTKAIHP